MRCRRIIGRWSVVNPLLLTVSAQERKWEMAGVLNGPTRVHFCVGEGEEDDGRSGKRTFGATRQAVFFQIPAAFAVPTAS